MSLIVLLRTKDCHALEKKSISITRLKQEIVCDLIGWVL